MLNAELIRPLGSLSLILVVLFGVAWFVKRFKSKQSQSTAIARIVGGVTLGARERVVVVEIANRWIIVGLAGGRMSALANLDAMPQEESAQAATPCGTILKNNNTLNDFASSVQQAINK